MSSYADHREGCREHAREMLYDADVVRRCVENDPKTLCLVLGHERRVPVLFVNRYLGRPWQPIEGLRVYGHCVRCGRGENSYTSLDAIERWWRGALGWEKRRPWHQ